MAQISLTYTYQGQSHLAPEGRESSQLAMQTNIAGMDATSILASSVAGQACHAQNYEAYVR